MPFKGTALPDYHPAKLTIKDSNNESIQLFYFVSKTPLLVTVSQGQKYTLKTFLARHPVMITNDSCDHIFNDTYTVEMK